MNKLNLGCGPKWKEQYPDYKGLDIIDYGQEYLGDIIQKLLDPYNAFNQIKWDEVMANHFLEHFDQDELKIIFIGINKRLVEGGLFKFVVPHMAKERAFILSHKTFWNEITCRWLGEKEARETYGFGDWEVIDVIVNERKDIHVLLKKI